MRALVKLTQSFGIDIEVKATLNKHRRTITELKRSWKSTFIEVYTVIRLRREEFDEYAEKK